jgi:hypothetical protein
MVNIFFVTLFSAVQFFVKNAGNGISEIFITFFPREHAPGTS